MPLIYSFRTCRQCISNKRTISSGVRNLSIEYTAFSPDVIDDVPLQQNFEKPSAHFLIFVDAAIFHGQMIDFHRSPNLNTLKFTGVKRTRMKCIQIYKYVFIYDIFTTNIYTNSIFAFNKFQSSCLSYL